MLFLLQLEPPTTFRITDTKHYVSVVALSTQDNLSLLKQIMLGFNQTIIWNKYKSKDSTDAKSQYLDYIIDPSFQRVNRHFVFSFENDK